MLNSFKLIGRVKYISRDNTNFVFSCARRNDDGEYLSDEFNIFLSDKMSSNILDCLKVGLLLGIKGHLESFKYTKEGKGYRQTRLYADQIEFEKED